MCGPSTDDTSKVVSIEIDTILTNVKIKKQQKECNL
jgi:hypothetical protein